jgi:hypothetical protein
MKFFTGSVSLLLSAVVLFAVSIEAADAATPKTPKRSLESCRQLARERGFSKQRGGLNVVAMRTFVVACMQGKQN